ncbi:MAG TPA: hypothetical protein VNO83_11240 [Pseudonocardia sp.]|nr:hypothetical protein [Pseudonocardia sp.]
MPEDDELARIVRKLAIEHAETRWLALRLDDDVKEIRGELRAVRAVQREHTDTLQEHSGILQEHTSILQEHTSILHEHSRQLDEHSRLLQEHTGRFDSVDAQLRSLTQLVGQVLERLPDEPAG